MVKKAVLLSMAVLVILGCHRDPAGAGTTDGAKPASGSVSAAEPTPAPPRATGPPELTFASTEHDFGIMPETETRSAELQFTNTGGAELVISKVKTSCGCTAATPNKLNYQPGERGVLQVSFDPSASGEQKKFINIFSNAHNTQAGGMTRLVISADVTAFLTLEPNYLRLGPLGIGEVHTAAVTVTCTDPQFSIDAVTTTNPLVAARVVEAAAGEPKRVEVTISADAPWGPIFSWLDVTVTGRPEPGAEPIRHTSKARVQGQLFGAISAEPDTFRVGVKPGATFERSVVLKRVSGEPFQILSATASAGQTTRCTVRVELRSPGTYELFLEGTAAGEGPLRGTVDVTTDVPGEEQLQIQISGTVRVDPGGVR